MTTRTPRAALAVLGAALALGACGDGDEEPGPREPARTTSTSTEPGATSSTGELPPPPAAPTTTDGAEPGGAPAPAPSAPAPSRAPATGGAEAEPEPSSSTPATPAAPQQNPNCKPGTGPGFPTRPQCEPLAGEDANEDESPAP